MCAYTPQERIRKQGVANRTFPGGHPLSKGQVCQLCGDPDCKVEPHSEDYSEPYLWDNPAEYAVCKRCHNRLHKRFEQPAAWEAYKRHLRRGGHGSDLESSSVASEVRNVAKVMHAGVTAAELPRLRDSALTGDEWWEKLSVDSASLTAPAARPRP